MRGRPPSSNKLAAQAAPIASASANQAFMDVPSEIAALNNAMKKRGEMPSYYSRLPRVGLACNLEEVLLLLYNSPKSLIFREPVVNVPGYYDVIKEPICLSDILAKITSFQYTYVREFVADLNRMVENCYKFNGPPNVSAYSKIAKELLEIALRQLNSNVAGSRRGPGAGAAAGNKFKSFEDLIIQKETEFKQRARAMELAAAIQDVPAPPSTSNLTLNNINRAPEYEDEGDGF